MDSGLIATGRLRAISVKGLAVDNYEQYSTESSMG